MSDFDKFWTSKARCFESVIKNYTFFRFLSDFEKSNVKLHDVNCNADCVLHDEKSNVNVELHDRTHNFVSKHECSTKHKF